MRVRTIIFYLLQSCLAHREIGRRLNKSHITISSEVRRNKRLIGCSWDHAAQSFSGDGVF